MVKESVIPFPDVGEQRRIADILDKADAIRRKWQEALELINTFDSADFYASFGDPGAGQVRWTWKSVQDCLTDGELIEVQDGNHGESHPKVAEFQSTGIPFVTANCLRNNTLDLNGCPCLTDTRAKQLRVGFARPGDALLTHKGSIGLTCVVPDSITDLVLSPQVTYYRVNASRLNANYLSSYFRTSFFQQLLTQRAEQSTRAYLGITRQRELPLMLPPITSQQAFIARQAKRSRLLQHGEHATEQSDSLFHSLVQQAFRGEL
jgi:type I restriction enzyme S subunit